VRKFMLFMRSAIYKLASLWENPVWAAAIALAIYLAYALHVNPALKASAQNYHNYLADAFLHGQLSLRLIPANSQIDLSLYNQKYYLYWPPLPAILMMPFVAVFGVDFSDVIFNLAFAVINVSLVALLLRKLNEKGIAELTPFQRSLLVLVFAFGTVHFTVAPYGTVWFTSSVIGFFFTILAYLSAITLEAKKGFFLAGLFIACAAMCRNTLLFAGIWPAAYLIMKNWNENRKHLYALIFFGALPIMIIGLSFLFYNWARFADPLQVGTKYQNMAGTLRKDVLAYGYFSFHYVIPNFYYQYIYYPLPETAETLMGGSLFLLSPVFFAAFVGIFKGKPRLSILFLIITIIAVDIPILLNFGTGWFQFGPRYTLDFAVPLLILTAIGVQSVPDWLLVVLSLVSVAHYYKGMSILNMLYRK
jgi:hypothetical protein